MLRKAKETKRQIIEQLNRRVLKETPESKIFQDKGVGKVPLGEEMESEDRHNKLVGYLQSLISREGFTVAEIWKAIKYGLTPQIKVNDRYVMGEPDVEYGDEEDTTIEKIMVPTMNPVMMKEIINMGIIQTMTLKKKNFPQ